MSYVEVLQSCEMPVSLLYGLGWFLHVTYIDALIREAWWNCGAFFFGI